MKTKHELSEIMNFVTEYASVQLGAGVHTSRVVRNTKRVGESLGVEINMTAFHRTAIVTLNDNEDEEHITEVVTIPTLPINFVLNSALSGLSWEAYDEKLSLEDLRKRFREVKEGKRYNPMSVALVVGLANASFCQLFGGDFLASLIVFVATVIGFWVKNWLTAKEIANYFVIAVSSFVASAFASVSVNFDCTANIALATSPLFLVPGVPLINGFIDIVEGYILIGMTRLVNALLIIICIAVGLSVTLIIIKNQLL